MSADQESRFSGDTSGEFHWRAWRAGEPVEGGRFTLSGRAGGVLAGELWAARDGDSGRCAWLYFPPEGFVRHGAVWDEFKRQLRRIKRLRHSTIAGVEELFLVAKPWPFVRLRPVSGSSMEALRLKEPKRILRWNQVRPFLPAIAAALDHAHEAKVFHRDLKPSNLLLDAGQAIRITGFGLDSLIAESSQRVSGAAMTPGSLFYRGPQQLDGADPDPSDDWYGLGAVLYELLTSTPPFFRGDLCHQIRHKVPPSPSARLCSEKIKGFIPEEVDTALGRCLAKNREGRPASASEFLELFGLSGGIPERRADRTASRSKALSTARASGSVGSDPVGTAEVRTEGSAEPYYPPPPMKNQKPAIFAVVSLIVVAVAIAGFSARCRLKPGPQRERAGPAAAASEGSAALGGGDGSSSVVLADGAWGNADRGALAIRTLPENAILTLKGVGNDEVRERVSPTVIRKLSPGAYELEVVAAGFEPTNMPVTVMSGLTNELSLQLEALHGAIELASKPPGAAFTVRRGTHVVLTGSTPRRLDLPVGPYSIELALGSIVKTQYVDLRGDRVPTVGVEFELGSILIRSLPPGAEVRYRGKLLGTTPFDAKELPVGVRSFELRMAGYESTQVTGRVDALVTSVLKAKLQRMPPAKHPQEWENSIGMRFIRLGDILMGAWETRFSDYTRFVEDAGDRDPVGDEWQHTSFLAQIDGRHPVVNVSWYEAKAFCDWLTAKEKASGLLAQEQYYRLPHDREWSWAVGLDSEAGDTPQERGEAIASAAIYPWGAWPPKNAVGNYAQVVDASGRLLVDYRDGFPFTAPVGSFLPNEYGFYDLGGNVWEWCEDWYTREKKRKLARGGSWNDLKSRMMTSAYRLPIDPDMHMEKVGFRCVLDSR